MRIAIIGGAGKMGRWLAALFLKEGREVVISGRSEQKLLEAKRALGIEVAPANVAAVRGADYVLLSVPVEGLEQVAAEIGPHIQPGQVVMDVASVKEMPVAAMHRHIKAGRVLGVHPLFGPGADGLSGQNLVLTPTDDEESALAQQVSAYLTGRGARVLLMSPREHDEAMAVVLGLSHFIALVSADTLLASGRLKETAGMAGTTYRVLLTLLSSVVAEDPQLYASLQMSLPGMAALEKLFLDRAEEWAGLVASQDRQEFARRMKGLRDEFEKALPAFGRAYERMYQLSAGW